MCIYLNVILKPTKNSRHPTIAMCILFCCIASNPADQLTDGPHYFLIPQSRKWFHPNVQWLKEDELQGQEIMDDLSGHWTGKIEELRLDRPVFVPVSRHVRRQREWSSCKVSSIALMGLRLGAYHGDPNSTSNPNMFLYIISTRNQNLPVSKSVSSKDSGNQTGCFSLSWYVQGEESTRHGTIEEEIFVVVWGFLVRRIYRGIGRGIFVSWSRGVLPGKCRLWDAR